MYPRRLEERELNGIFPNPVRQDILSSIYYLKRGLGHFNTHILSISNREEADLPVGLDTV
jgi:hypothetical protein